MKYTMLAGYLQKPKNYSTLASTALEPKAQIQGSVPGSRIMGASCWLRYYVGYDHRLSSTADTPDTLSGAILEAALVLPLGGGKLVDLQK